MLFTDEVETMDELVRKLKDNESLHKIKVAVVCFLVEPDGKWTLHRRGAAARDNQGKLQALGGSYNVSDGTFKHRQEEIAVRDHRPVEDGGTIL